ncbi:hypothetical protein QBC46DRAFT_420464 [Diplogelasinospora grovesii]|uniref:Uncharacterized protein n=1 Tax=Diplogelasinospora grovesii TaxID=303347 RepID=A0AAN6MYQ8_9PEZI|nr:hypothetical protein QBC46DRAFT_420464 [Diplogelasinospora grovesii]
MGCFGLFKRKRRTNETSAIGDFVPRPQHNSVLSNTTTLYDPEKNRFRDRSALPSGIAPVRLHVNPAYSAYSTPADFNGPRFRGGGAKDSDNWTDTPMTKVASDSVDFPSKLKEDDVDDPEEALRRRKAEEAKRKAEREEQERLDFFQMM